MHHKQFSSKIRVSKNMNHINQLVKFSGSELKGLHILDEETIKKIDNAEEYLYFFDRDFRLLQCVLDNHESFQLELKNQLIEGAYDNVLGESVDLSKYVRIIDKWLLNILSSFKALLEHLQTRITRSYGKDSKEYNQLKSAYSYEFDNVFSYAFSYKLRNYIQHCGMPKITFNINTTIDHEITNQIEFSLELDLHRDDLLSNYDSWTTVKSRLAEQEDKICLLNVLDELMQSLIRIFSKIKDLISYKEATEAQTYILSIINENETYQEQNYGICKGIEKSGEKLKIQNRILKTKLFESLNSFNSLIN